MRCPNCSHDVSDETGYCPACGSELPLEAIPTGKVHFSTPALVVDPAPPAKHRKESYSAMQGLRLANAVWGFLLLICGVILGYWYLVLR